MKPYRLFSSLCALYGALLTAFAAQISYANNAPQLVKGEYSPLLEVGKEWRYVMRADDYYFPAVPDDYLRTLKVVDCLEQDGLMYYRVSQTASRQEDEPVRRTHFFMEDVANQRVYYRYNYGNYYEDYEPGVIPTDNYTLLYDFKNMEECHEDVRLWESQEAGFELKDGVHKGYTGQAWYSSECYVIEGVGFVSGRDGFWTNERFPRIPSHICGIDSFVSFYWATAFPKNTYYPNLYAVVAPDGTEILTIDDYYPAGIGSVNADTAGVRIECDGRKLQVLSNDAIGEIELMNMQGVLVKRHFTNDAYCELSLADLASGVYVVKTTRIVEKIVVKS